ncbi:hypothetical protein [Pollutimonas bauzanensis]|uniref:Uncharacterized protein n=1 Tax=Pollutimonas bauzanensis TaxID=658167 RepID=A0A1M5XMB3_9BURK|nr:hypothetical protein [Pollutimonas bauzanensis]SHI00792.1 hypothetical protein SAMN04488135_1079 [Pollutimonas bauzanensis]
MMDADGGQKQRIQQKEDELRDRVIYLAMDLAPAGRGIYRYLEERTGIPAARWQNVMLKRQLPTLAMLIALLDYRRPYAEWLLTGDDLGQGRSPSNERWESFLKHREWVQGNKAAGKED